MDKKSISVQAIYYGSDGAATRQLLRRLEKTGTLGSIAAQLFRAQKTSRRAKSYRGGIRHGSGTFTSYSDLSYETKDRAICGLCSLLRIDPCGLTWGWKADPSQPFAKFVVYVDLPNGQCSFHLIERYAGPDYLGEWDGQGASEERIIEFCEMLLDGRAERQLTGKV